MDHLNNFSRVSLMVAYWSLRVSTKALREIILKLMCVMSFLLWVLSVIKTISSWLWVRDIGD
jgi:hypothetical protein